MRRRSERSNSSASRRATAGLGRITTDGTVLSDVVPPNTLANGNGVAAHGDDIFFAAFNTHSIWRYNVPSNQFTEYVIPTPGASPSEVAVDAQGTVWFTDAGTNQIGRLDLTTPPGNIT